MSQTSQKAPILVTGGTGFVAQHLILQLLAAGYNVRTTVRNLEKEETVRKTLKNAGASDGNRLLFFAADLTKDAGWAEAVHGCAYVHHVASPFPSEAPKTEDELIIPAREGTLRVLRAARDAGVKRVVFTSSFAAIGYGHPPHKEVFTEEDWSILDGSVPVPAYHKSKTLAERAAWKFIEEDGGNLELTVLNPVGIFGPILSAEFSASIQLIKKLVDGSMPACPQIYFGIVDVRDLADLHIRAMTAAEAKNRRFIAMDDAGSTSLLSLADTIRQNRPEAALKVPTRQLPNWVVRTMGLFIPELRALGPQLGDKKNISNANAKSTLDWTPRSTSDTVVDTVDSLVKYKIV